MNLVAQILAAGLAASLAVAPDAGDPSKVKPLQSFQGGDSHIHKPLARFLTDAKSWKQVWYMHLGIEARVSDKGEIEYPPNAPTPPPVDFSKNQVLVMFGGLLPGVQSYDYVKTFAKETTAVVQIAPKTAPASSDSALKNMYPFLIMVLPKEPVRIEVELDTVAKDGSHYWNLITAHNPPKPGGS